MIRFTKVSFKIRMHKTVDIIIFTKTGSYEIITNLLKKNCTYSIYDCNKITLYINLYFIYKLLINIFKYKNSKDKFFKHLYLCYVFTEIECINPEIVITFEDDNHTYHRLNSMSKTLKFMAIQNGLREKYHLSRIINKDVSHEIYFCFGENDIDKIKSYHLDVKKPMPIGSLRAGIALEKFKNVKKIYDLCYISEWKENYPEFSEYENPYRIDNKWSYFSRFVDNIIFYFYKRNNIKLVIALRSDNPKEKEYFISHLDSNVIFTKTHKSNYRNYKTIMESYITAGFASTLLLESIALGTKVLSIDPSLSSKYFNYDKTIKYHYDKYIHFEKYLLELIDSKNNKKLEYTNNSSAMNVSINDLPQNIIKKTINEYLK